VAIAALHNPTSAMLDMLPPLDEVRARARARARARVRFSDMLPPLD